MADGGVNITWHEHKVSSDKRRELMGNKGAVIWFTGLSGSGKSTIANTVDHKLHQLGKKTYVLDGDNIRFGLNKDKKSLVEKAGFSEEAGARFGVGFSAEDRMENIRRIGEVSKLFSDAAIITLTAFISPYRIDRDNVRKILAEGEFIEIYVKASLDTCEKRDPKGLYKKARAGELKGFTGIDAPYEEPENPELVLDSDGKGIEELADEVIAYLDAKGYLKA
ncbi:adenylyl-sulfate kinase [Planctomicrobium sp. SH668]|uniref:adenylyl-sulfate kinase n=1 Tax=Planctomicrobium sp. SH668 TaxID=3448126 RepID=UPI003F5C0565